MLKELEELLRTREQVVELGPHKLIVRELASAADMAGAASEEDLAWMLLVRCTFAEDGTPAFTVEDIPALKAASNWKLGPLVSAVNRVNGFNVEAEAKNSDAVPV